MDLQLHFEKEDAVLVFKNVSESEKAALRDNIQRWKNGEPLDVSPDVLLTKQAPIDELPQRSGRFNRKAGTLKGLVLYMAPDFDDELEDFEEYM